MDKWTEFRFLLKNPYLGISKGSVVTVEGETFILKRIDRIILLDDAVGEPNAVQVFARGVRH
ncbi:MULTISPECIES: hypothetical protein [Lysinibacillus]|uniref:hypothetical protein n=1 Tax=Lysinibacillus TaxID=400634 RepID=UPI0005619DD2|nr:hypothetical protein [Lysinibacillus sphaericus]